MTRECPHPDCHEAIPPHRYACGRHWYKLPKDLRRAINRTWNMRLGDPTNPERIEEHEQAKARADKWLEEHPTA